VDFWHSTSFIARHLGYKRTLIRDLNRLSVGVNLDYFRQILGSPVFVNSLPEDHSEHIFVNNHFYVQAITGVGEQWNRKST
jgi:hypothetical protein